MAGTNKLRFLSISGSFFIWTHFFCIFLFVVKFDLLKCLVPFFKIETQNFFSFHSKREKKKKIFFFPSWNVNVLFWIAPTLSFSTITMKLRSKVFFVDFLCWWKCKRITKSFHYMYGSLWEANSFFQWNFLHKKSQYNKRWGSQANINKAHSNCKIKWILYSSCLIDFTIWIKKWRISFRILLDTCHNLRTKICQQTCQLLFFPFYIKL